MDALCGMKGMQHDRRASRVRGDLLYHAAPDAHRVGHRQASAA